MSQWTRAHTTAAAAAAILQRQFQDFEVQAKFAIDRQSLSAYGRKTVSVLFSTLPQFSASDHFVCILSAFRRIFCRKGLSAKVTCQDFLGLRGLCVQVHFVCRICRQSLSAGPAGAAWLHSHQFACNPPDDKRCLQHDKLCLRKFVCSNLAWARRVGGT